ncbi:MAG: hypothetical protein WDN31_06685 [Hyphomicrobium sp.]
METEKLAVALPLDDEDAALCSECQPESKAQFRRLDVGELGPQRRANRTNAVRDVVDAVDEPLAETTLPSREGGPRLPHIHRLDGDARARIDLKNANDGHGEKPRDQSRTHQYDQFFRNTT